MKQFNYDLLENKRDLLEQDNSGEERVYHAPKGTYPSVTSVLYHIINKSNIEAWRARVGKEKADKITHKAAKRGTSVHHIIEKYLRGDENYLEGQLQRIFLIRHQFQVSSQTVKLYLLLIF